MRRETPIVSLENTDVDIGGRRVLRNIFLTITAGRQLGLIGENGSGKSTLLALIAGQRWPAPGRGSRVYDFGFGPERDAITARQRIALVGHELQDLYVARGWNFLARDIVTSGLTRTEIPRRRVGEDMQQAALDLLATMGLGHLAGRRLLELSRGEQRRVLITRSLAFDPAVLLLDEPASGLDAPARAALDETLARAARRALLVVAVHRQDQLPAFVTDIAKLEAGRLETLATEPGRAARASAAEPSPKRRRSSTGTGSARARSARAGAARASDSTVADSDRVIIELENASVWLGNRQVLESIDWRLRSGEHWLVTGPNGAGKSTFLRLLHAELRPARGGSIRWPGLGDPRDVWTLRRRIALVSPELQARYRYPSSVFEAVASGFHSSIGLVQPLSPAEVERVTQLLEALGLAPMRDRPLSTLSYGQRHRALIARCLIADPGVVLLDEPWEGLDAATCDIIAAELTRRMADGTQIICASHSGPAGLDFNRALSLEAGVLKRADDSAEPHENSASEPTLAAGCPPR